MLTFVEVRDAIAGVVGRRSWVPDAIGLLWVVIAGVAGLVPALLHGVFLGPYDILSGSGLTAHPGVVVHNPDTADQLTLFISWTDQVWNQVHHGHIPLWNPYSGFGMPLAFNWESAPISVPAFVGYLAPVRYAYTIGVLTTVTIAGTGAYVLGRVLRLSVIAAAFAGTAFALSGPMFTLLGWSAGAVASLGGWIFACGILVIRGDHRIRSIGMFALVLALVFYAGHPETSIMMLIGLGVFIVVLLGSRLLRSDQSPTIFRPVIDLASATVLGLLLAAPLLLPGLQLAGSSVRNLGTPSIHLSSNIDSLSWHDTTHLIFPSFDGSPTSSSSYFGSITYEATAAYFGVIVLVLAVLAVVTRWRRAEVIAFGVLALAMAVLAFAQRPVGSLVGSIPLFREVALYRALFPMALALAMLGAFGIDSIIRSPQRRRIRAWGITGFLAAGILLLGLWIFGRGHLPRIDAHIRSQSFWWPVVGTAVGLSTFLFLALTDRKVKDGPHGRTNVLPGRHIAAGILLLGESALLISAGAPLWSSTASVPGPTATVTQLQRSVGSGTVGFSQQACFYAFTAIGILPNYNVALQVHEVAVYDPLIPKSYFTTWRSVTGSPGGIPIFDLFCPAVDSSDIARRFGIEYVLSAHGAPVPGGLFVRSVGNEDLYRIPGASAAILVPARPTDTFPPAGALGTPVPVSYPNPSTWKLTTATRTPQVLRLHLTDVPGWRATIDGAPLALERFSGTMLQARIPPGRHWIVVTYWPQGFSIGLFLCGLAIVAWVLVAALGRLSGRNKLNVDSPASSNSDFD